MQEKLTLTGDRFPCNGIEAKLRSEIGETQVTAIYDVKGAGAVMVSLPKGTKEDAVVAAVVRKLRNILPAGIEWSKSDGFKLSGMPVKFDNQIQRFVEGKKKKAKAKAKPKVKKATSAQKAKVVEPKPPKPPAS